jgi:MFS family permease
MGRMYGAAVLNHTRDFLLFRSYWGYYVVAALFVAEIAVTGVSFYSFSLYIRAWQADPEFATVTSHVGFSFSFNPLALTMEIARYVRALSQSWSLTAINFSFALSLLIVPCTPFIGRLIDRRGAKAVMLASVPMVAVSFFLRAFMTEVWHLWILQVVLVLGQSAALLGTGYLVGLWFQKNRGFMMGLTMAGNNAGGIVMAPLSAYLITAVGWRTMFLIFGAGLFLINFGVLLFLVRDKMGDVARAARKAGRPEELAVAESALRDEAAAKGAEVSDSSHPALGAGVRGWQWRQALGTWAFWLISIAQLTSFVSVFAVLNQLGKHLEIVGLNISTAGVALGFLGLFGLLGKLIFGFASEQFPVRFVFALCLVLQIIGVLILLGVTSDARLWLLYPFVVLYGLGFGAMGALQPLIVLQTFGLVAYATLMGIMQIFLRSANAITPVAVGASVDATGTYTTVFIATIALLSVGTFLVLFARLPARKVFHDPPPAG